MSRHVDIDLFDPVRQRPIPVRLWLSETAPRAWVLFSVGFGGNRSGYAYLGRAWAALGLATAIIEHVGSNQDVLKGLPGKTVAERHREVVKKVSDPAELAARPRDVALVREHLHPRFAELPLGLAGHSYGAYTTLAALGLPTVPVLPPLEGLSGVGSTLVISPSPPGHLFSPRALSRVSLPTLVLTGTKDGPLSGEGDYRGRAAVYDALPEPHRNLVVLEGAEHMAFANIGLGLGPTLLAIERLTGHWWQSTLLSDPQPTTERAKQMKDAVAGAIQGEYR